MGEGQSPEFTQDCLSSPFFVFFDYIKILVDQMLRHTGDLADEFHIRLLPIACSDAVEVFQVAIYRLLCMFDFLCDFARVFLFIDDFHDDGRLMCHAAPEVLQAAGMRKDFLMAILPAFSPLGDRRALTPGQ